MGNPAGGQITISFIRYDNGAHNTQTSAAFWRASLPSGAPDPCVTKTHGQCTVQTCPSTLPEPPPPATAAPSAGTVTLTAASASYAKTLNPNAGYGAYGSDLDSTVNFVGGEVVSVSATGSEIPAFSGNLAMPTPFVLTNDLPARNSAANIPFDAGQDLTLDFTGGTSDLVVQVNGLQGSGSGATTSHLYCFFDSAPGTLTIPAEALAPLGAYALVQLFTLRRSTVVAGAYNVLFVFGMDVNAADGLPARFAGVP